MAERPQTARTEVQHPLSVHRAFVVQWRAEADIAHGRVTGRVKHVVSGQATHFHALEALLAFMARVRQETGMAGGKHWHAGRDLGVDHPV